MQIYSFILGKTCALYARVAAKEEGKKKNEENMGGNGNPAWKHYNNFKKSSNSIPACNNMLFSVPLATVSCIGITAIR